MLSIKAISTIRFKLTLLYSFILLVLTSLVVLGLNIALSAWMSSDPPTPPSSSMGMITQFPRGTMLWLNLSDKERESIREIRKNDLETFQALSIVSLLPISVISFILGYIIAGKFLKPIDELADTLQHMQSEHLGKTLPKSSDDEVGRLIDSFNNMSTSLKKSFESQQRLVQDASHEIKTPLAIIQTSLDSTLDDKKASSRELREAMEDALLGVKRLRKLADDLLTITTPFETNEVLNITKIVKKQLELLTPYAEKCKVEIKSDIQTDGEQVRGNASQLGRSIFNLVENAIKFSKGSKDAVVTVETKQDGIKVIIAVSDNGPGIDKKLEKQVFERFVRGRKDSEGNGLGLAISKDIVEAHLGTLTLLESKQGARFEIRLPVLV